MITKYPESYPVITANGQKYTYDAGENPGSNTYSIKWAYIKDETGANNGNNHFISGQAYHVDGYAVLNTAGKVTVDFKIKNLNSDGLSP